MAWPDTSLVVEAGLALGADLTADPATYAYTDITSKTFDRDGNSSIVITRGRADESTVAQPSQTTCAVNNSDGRFLDHYPVGPYYGTLRRSTPLRVRVNPGSGLDTRNVAYIYEMPPRWQVGEVDYHVPIKAAGILRRLGQGNSPLRSALYRAITASAIAPVAYWPMEEGSEATRFLPAVGTIPLYRELGPDIRSGVAGAPGSAAAVEVEAFDTGFSDGPPGIAGTGVVSLSSTVVVASVMAQVGTASDPPAGASSAAANVFQLLFSGGTVWFINALASKDVSTGDTSFEFSIFFRDTSGASTGAVSSLAFDGRWHEIQLRLEQNGTSVDVDLVVDGSVVKTDSYASQTLGTGVKPQLWGGAWEGASGHLQAFPVAVCHLAIWDDTSVTNFAEAGQGYSGELAGARFARLCTEESIPYDVRGTDLTTYAMGAQGVATLLNLLRECEAASAGVIVDRRTGGLGLDLNSYRENQAVALTLDYAAKRISPPLEPTDDDQRTRNDVTVIASNTSRAIDEDGPLGVTAVGRYDEQVTISLDPDDPDLPFHHASWRVHLGTTDVLRFPTITVNLRRNTTLIAAWLALDIGSRIRLTNLPDRISYDDIDLVVEGYTEQISQKNWVITFNCAPYAHGVFDISTDSSPDTNEFAGRLAADPAAAIRTAVNSSATSIDVDPNFWRFTTVADHFDPDLDLRFGGEVVSVSAISTVAATYVGRGAMSSADNAAVSPTTTGFGAVDGDLLCCLGRIRGTAGSLTATAGWTLMAQVGKLYLWGQVRSGTTPITLTPSGGAAGDTVSGTVFALHNMPLTVTPSDLVLEVLSQSNAAAQDITFPGILPFYEGTIVFLLAGKSDDWTSVAVPAGYTESGEPTTTTGNDQSLYLAYQIQTTQALVSGGSAVVTGGAAAVSESMVLSLAAGYQTLTVSARSVNGVVKSQTAGSLVNVDDAFPMAL